MSCGRNGLRKPVTEAKEEPQELGESVRESAPEEAGLALGSQSPLMGRCRGREPLARAAGPDVSRGTPLPGVAAFLGWS